MHPAGFDRSHVVADAVQRLELRNDARVSLLSGSLLLDVMLTMDSWYIIIITALICWTTTPGAVVVCIASAPQRVWIW